MMPHLQPQAEGSFRVNSTKKNENLHLTFFNFAQILFLGLFWLKKLKFQIWAQSDVRFSRYDTPIFTDFR